MSRMWKCCLAGLLLAASAVQAANPDADVARLGQRLQALDADAAAAGLASYERLQARRAVDALATAGSRQRADALQLAEWRVETAELATRTELMRRQIAGLERELNELKLEAIRREAALARAEAERLRIQAQIQAEEAERLRQMAEAEAAARQEAETVLQNVSAREAARLKAAREREAELKRQEQELLKVLGEQP
jgi:hypothetical protein